VRSPTAAAAFRRRSATSIDLTVGAYCMGSFLVLNQYSVLLPLMWRVRALWSCNSSVLFVLRVRFVASCSGISCSGELAAR
jgi:hypothetical protein